MRLSDFEKTLKVIKILGYPIYTFKDLELFVKTQRG